MVDKVGIKVSDIYWLFAYMFGHCLIGSIVMAIVFYRFHLLPPLLSLFRADTAVLYAGELPTWLLHFVTELPTFILYFFGVCLAFMLVALCLILGSLIFYTIDWTFRLLISALVIIERNTANGVIGILGFVLFSVASGLKFWVAPH